MSRKPLTRIVSTCLVVTLLGSLLHLNVVVAAAAPGQATLVASAAGRCTTPLTAEQMASVRGGSWLNDLASAVTGALDAGCAAAGVGAALGFVVDPIGGAFCAGWGLGRLLS
jgi:hypothetical protein